MQNNLPMDFLQRLAKGIAAQFGHNCEVVVHDMSVSNTIRVIENGRVSNRKVGDGPSHVVLEALKGGHDVLSDHIAYLTKTQDGRVLKSSTIYIRDDNSVVTGIFAINYDITELLAAESALQSILNYTDREKAKQESDGAPRIPHNVNQLLFELIDQSVQHASGGKPPALMTKEEKKKALQFLSDSGAFLITKSGDHISNYFGISKYTLYNYIDVKGQDTKTNE